MGDSEIGKVVVGPPGLQAHFAVRRGAFAWFARIFRRQEPQRLRIWHARATIWVPEDDDGSIDLYFEVINFGRKAAQVNQIHLQYVRAGGYNLSITAPLFTPPSEPVPARGHSEIYTRIPLGAPAIRLLLRTIQPAQNAKSTPQIELAVGGLLLATAGRVPVRESFECKTAPTLLHFNCPSVRA